MEALQGIYRSAVSQILAHPVYVLLLLFFGRMVYQRMQPFPEDEEGGPEKIKDLDMWNSLLKTDNILVVDFYATWCPPCRVGQYSSCSFVARVITIISPVDCCSCVLQSIKGRGISRENFVLEVRC